MRKLEHFDTSQMKNKADGPAANDIKQANEAEKQLHIDARFGFDANFEENDIYGVEDC